MNKKIYILLMILSLFALLITLYPDVKVYTFKSHQQKQIEEFKKVERNQIKTDELYQSMKDYNEKIYQDKQSGLVDNFSYMTNDFEKDLIGYIEIDKIGLSTPLYIGASYENLNKGVAVLSQTSMPIGGNNTNCVIAGHRGGYYGELFFRDIEQLEIGDEIKLTNPWQTLEYKVSGTTVIYPSDIDAVKIQEGKDMLTLFTCHPHGIDSHRYVVYATRDKVEKIENYKKENNESSINKIKIESLIKKVLVGFIFIFILIVNIKMMLDKRKGRI